MIVFFATNHKEFFCYVEQNTARRGRGCKSLIIIIVGVFVMIFALQLRKGKLVREDPFGERKSKTKARKNLETSDGFGVCWCPTTSQFSDLIVQFLCLQRFVCSSHLNEPNHLKSDEFVHEKEKKEKKRRSKATWQTMSPFGK